VKALASSGVLSFVWPSTKAKTIDPKWR
jgi:hypothetical protein